MSVTITRVLACTVLLALCPGLGWAETARRADDFVDSIGVATHWTYTDTPYVLQYEKVRDLLAASGIRHVRDSINARVEDLARRGIRTCAITHPNQGTPEAIRDRIKAMNAKLPVIDAVEGPNEPDLFWPNEKATYKGQGFPEGSIAFQKDLYRAMKADPATRKIPVIGMAMGKTYDPGGGSPHPFANGLLEAFVDWGNFHPYPGGNPFSVPFAYAGLEKFYWQGTMPSGNLDEFPYALNVYRPPYGNKPMAATETGYSTDVNGTSESVHAAYMPRLFAEYFRLGVVRTFSYELVDEWQRPDDREANFGLIRNDLSPKPAYIALKSLLSLLEDRPKDGLKPFTPKPLELGITVQPMPGYDRTQYVHHLLLQKRNGEYDLLLWHEVSGDDNSTKPRRLLVHPSMPVSLRLPASAQQTTVYTYDTTWHLLPKRQVVRNRTLNLVVNDRITVVRLPGKAAQRINIASPKLKKR